MTKRINWLANERVDVPDLTDGTNTLSTGLVKQFNNQAIIDKFARVANGFRVEIADQALNPGQFTIYNGYAFDRSGQLVVNEEQENASRSYTCAADATYYVEIQFTEDASNVDARGFWDPTVDNGTYPSGDPKLPGREFFQNVSTRITPDWQIVTPVSTTGFAVDTDPNTTKIPVAVITVAGGLITGTTEKASTVTARDAAIGVTQLYVLDSRVFPDVFNATVDAEAVVVTSNDRTNGILYLSVATAAVHSVGARVVQTGGLSGFPDFVPESASPIPPLPSAATQDARPRFWQGDEERGYALTQQPTTATGRSDLNVQSLKDEIDFLSAQLRELKFGAIRAADLGKIAPPISGAGAYSSNNRYFSHTGGVENSRSVTVSVGDGVNSWGDFNVAQLGSADAAFTAAYSALPSSGGTIFVKNGTYSFSAGLSCSGKSFALIGETPTGVTLTSSAASPVFDLADSANYVFEYIYFKRTGTASFVVTTSGVDMSVTMRNCRVEGMDCTAFSNNYFENVIFEATSGGNKYGLSLHAGTIPSKFVHCTFVNSLNDASASAVLVDSINNVFFDSCYFNNTSASATVLVKLAASFGSPPTEIDFVSCVFEDNAGTNCISVVSTGAVDGVSFRNCYSSAPKGFVDFSAGACTSLLIDGCRISYSNNALSTVHAVHVGSSNSNAYISVLNCRIQQTGTYTVGISSSALYLEYAAKSSVSNCVIENADVGISAGTLVDVTITDCTVSASANTFGIKGIAVTSAVQNSFIRNCTIIGIQNTLATSSLIGIDVTSTISGLSIIGCVVKNLGYSTFAQDVYGIRIAPASLNSIVDLEISGNALTSVNTTTICYGISVDRHSTNTVISSNKLNTVGVNADAVIGVQASGSRHSAVCNNLVDLGLNTAATFCAGIRFLADTAAAIDLDCVKVQVSGNVIPKVSMSDAVPIGTAFKMGGIVIEDAGSEFVINGNVVNSYVSGSPNFSGIVVYGNTYSPKNTIISSNQVGTTDSGNFGTGIYVYLDTAATACKSVSVVGNTVNNATSSGIAVSGPAASGPPAANGTSNFVVSTNSVYVTAETCLIGIIVSNVDYFSITGNSVDMSSFISTHAAVGISFQGGSHGSISTNRVVINKMTNNGSLVYVSSSSLVSVVGNALMLTDTTVGAAGNGITFSGVLTTKNSTFSNHILMKSGLTAINAAGAGTINFTAVRNDVVVQPAPTLPADTSHIGTNLPEAL